MPTYGRSIVKLKFQLESTSYRECGFLGMFTELSRRVSTIKLPVGGGYETCIFNPPARTNEVVAVYDTEDEAILGHMKIIRNMGLTSAKYMV
jgi:hypothetical protein